MRILTRSVAALGLVSLALASPLSGVHAASTSAVTGHIYVDDNTVGVNTVAGFDRHADGSLTAIAGSPFAIGGAGSKAAVGSQGALQVSADGHYLLAVDPGSNQISVLSIKASGALAPVMGSPFSSGGKEPVSIALHQSLVYVANAGDGGSNYTGFSLNPDGSLWPLPGSTVSVPKGAGLGQVLFNSTGTRLIGIRVNPSLIDSFTVDFGRLVAAPGSPYSAQTAGPFGSEFRPINPAQLFVSNAHAGTGNGTVSAITVGENGDLSSIGASPFADNQTAPCWLTITADGQYLFAVNTLIGSISRYTIAADGSLTLLGSTPLHNAANAHPTDISIDPSGKYAYVVEAMGDAVATLSVSGGQLTELSQSPTALPTGAKPFGVAVSGPTDLFGS